jgi:hypothetical protein
MLTISRIFKEKLENYTIEAMLLPGAGTGHLLRQGAYAEKGKVIGRHCGVLGNDSIQSNTASFSAKR